MSKQLSILLEENARGLSISLQRTSNQIYFLYCINIWKFIAYVCLFLCFTDYYCLLGLIKYFVIFFPSVNLNLYILFFSFSGFPRDYNASLTYGFQSIKQIIPFTTSLKTMGHQKTLIPFTLLFVIVVRHFNSIYKPLHYITVIIFIVNI